MIKLDPSVAAEIWNRFVYYKDMHDRDQISDDEYINKLAILKYDMDKEVDKLLRCEGTYSNRGSSL